MENKKKIKHTPKEKTSIKYTISQLLDKADENIDMFHYEIAEKFCVRALDIEPDDLRALETCGSLKLELGQFDEAKKNFLKAAELKPESGHAKYMYLGQLHSGQDAVTYFEKGIDVMLKEKLEVGEARRSGAAAVSSTDISTAFCSVAEIYLTDLCFEDGADVKCKENASKAIEVDASNSEALRIMADCLMSMGDNEGAREVIKKSVGIWLSRVRAEQSTGASTVTDGDQDDYNPVRVTPVPYESRINSAKILIELAEYDLASDALESLLDENDSVTEVWYLLGWLNYLQGDDYATNARFYLSKSQTVYAASDDADEQVMEHAAQLLAELGPGDEDGEDDDDVKDDFHSSSDSDDDDEAMEQS